MVRGRPFYGVTLLDFARPLSHTRARHVPELPVGRGCSRGLSGVWGTLRDPHGPLAGVVGVEDHAQIPRALPRTGRGVGVNVPNCLFECLGHLAGGGTEAPLRCNGESPTGAAARPCPVRVAHSRCAGVCSGVFEPIRHGLVTRPAGTPARQPGGPIGLGPGVTPPEQQLPRRLGRSRPSG